MIVSIHSGAFWRTVILYFKKEGKEKMKKIIKWLNENGIEYTTCKYGNPYYFNDGFSVDGIKVTFFFDEIGNSRDQEKSLVKYMSRKRAYICKCSRFGAGYSYCIMTVFDAARLQEHEKAVQDAVEKFWQEEHARRMTTAAAV